MNESRSILYSVGAMLLLLVFAAGRPVLGDDSQWQGTIAAGGYGTFPPTGYYAASDSFPRNTVVTVENLDNGKTASVIVVDRLSTPGLFMTVSSEAATELGISSDSIVQARVTLTDENQEYSGSYIDLAKSRDPDVNPSASFMDGDELDFLESVLNAKGIDTTTPNEQVSLDLEQTPITQEDTEAVESAAENEPLSVEEMGGVSSTTPGIEEMQSELALALPDRVGAVPEMPDGSIDIATVYGVETPVPAETPVSLVTDVIPLPPKVITEDIYEIAAMYADAGTETMGSDSRLFGPTIFLPEPSVELVQAAGGTTPQTISSEDSFLRSYEFAHLRPYSTTIRDSMITTPEIPVELEKWPRLSGSMITPKGEPGLALAYMPIPETIIGDITTGYSSIPLVKAEPGTSIDTEMITLPSPPETRRLEPRIVDAPVTGDEGAVIESDLMTSPEPPDESGSDPGTEEPVVEEPDIAMVSPLDGVATERSDDLDTTPEIPEDAVIVLEPAEKRPPEGPPDVVVSTESTDESPGSSIEPSPEASIASEEKPVNRSEVQTEVESEAKPELVTTTPSRVPDTATSVAESPDDVLTEGRSSMIRITEALARGSHYLQIGSFSEEKSARSVASRLAGEYPMTMYVDDGTEKRYFRIMVGPLTPDESGVVLLNLRSEGYSDAFVRKIE